MRLVLVSAALLASAPAAALSPAPTRQAANECRVLAYKEYPYQRPGKVKGSPARYEFFKDCLAKRSNSDAAQPPEPKQQ